MPASRSASRALSSATRVEILRLLQVAPGPLAVPDVAAAVERHENTVREHLDRLVEARFATRSVESRGTRGRPRILYGAVRRAAGATLDDRLREGLTRIFLEDLGAAGDPDGRVDGALAPAAADDERRQLAALEVHLEDLGLEPDPAPGGRAVALRPCPFVALARERTELTCAVHLDVIKGVLDAAGGPLTADRLEPFVQPQRCLLHLAPR